MQNIQKVNCLLCNSITELKHNAFPGYQVGMQFEIYTCKNCNTSFSLPRTDAGKIYEVIYHKGDAVPGYNRYWEYFRTVKNRSNPLNYLAFSEVSYWGIQSALKQVVKNKQSTRIIEIGCGLGYLTYSLRKDNYNIYGLDISQEAVNQANDNFGEYYICQDLFEYAKTNVNSYDVVILTEVIEHVETPIGFLEAIMKILKPNGQIILTTPNKSLLPSDIVWDTDLPPVHCWWFSEESMVYIAKQLNANASFINFSKYYKRNYHLHKVNKIRESGLPTPIFNENWELIVKSKKPKKIKAIYQQIIFNIPFVKTLYIKMKCYYNPDIISCEERGISLCVIFQKK